jgi:hypothetical protein
MDCQDQWFAADDRSQAPFLHFKSFSETGAFSQKCWGFFLVILSHLLGFLSPVNALKCSSET